MGRALTIAITLTLTLAPRAASAFERQQHLGGGAGGLVLVPVGQSGRAVGGGALDLHYGYGWTDSLNLVAEGSLGLTGTNLLAGGALAGGVTYAFDVVQWVPYIGVLAGVGGYGRADLDVVGALGIDYQASRSFAVGLALREHAFALTSPKSAYLGTFAFLRAEAMWGW